MLYSFFLVTWEKEKEITSLQRTPHKHQLAKLMINYKDVLEAQLEDLR